MTKEIALKIVDSVLPVGPKKVYARKLEFSEFLIRVTMFSHGEALVMKFIVDKESVRVWLAGICLLRDPIEMNTLLVAETEVKKVELDGDKAGFKYICDTEEMRAAINLVTDDVFKEEIYNDK